jgi:hypothetical protein
VAATFQLVARCNARGLISAAARYLRPICARLRRRCARCGTRRMRASATGLASSGPVWSSTATISPLSNVCRISNWWIVGSTSDSGCWLRYSRSSSSSMSVMTESASGSIRSSSDRRQDSSTSLRTPGASIQSATIASWARASWRSPIDDPILHGLATLPSLLPPALAGEWRLPPPPGSVENSGNPYRARYAVDWMAQITARRTGKCPEFSTRTRVSVSGASRDRVSARLDREPRTAAYSS